MGHWHFVEADGHDGGPGSSPSLAAVVAFLSIPNSMTQPASTGWLGAVAVCCASVGVAAQADHKHQSVHMFMVHNNTVVSACVHGVRLLQIKAK